MAFAKLYDRKTRLTVARPMNDRVSQSKLRLVDGGHFENSGAAKAVDLITAIVEAAENMDKNVRVSIHIDLLVFTSSGFASPDGFRERGPSAFGKDEGQPGRDMLLPSLTAHDPSRKWPAMAAGLTGSCNGRSLAQPRSLKQSDYGWTGVTMSRYGA